MPAIENMMTEREAARAMGIKPQTLAVWRMRGIYGLPFVKVGRSIRYRPEAVSQWLEKNTATCVTQDPV